MPFRNALLSLLVPVLAPVALAAQVPPADPADVVTPEAVVTAAYKAIQRAPGAPFDWDRFRSLFIPGAILIPNAEQTGGQSRSMSPDDFVDFVDAFYAENAPIGSDKDQGFAETEVARVIERYGDVAQVLSTYQKHVWQSDEILARGINSFQLVQRDNRWWIVSIAWDEDYAAGPIPVDTVREGVLNDRHAPVRQDPAVCPGYS